MRSSEPKFPLGHVVITPGAGAILSGLDVAVGLARHQSGNWGDLCPEDKAENEFSLKEGFRLLSAYCAEDGKRFWIITEADRSVTTILLPDEY